MLSWKQNMWEDDWINCQWKFGQNLETQKHNTVTRKIVFVYSHNILGWVTAHNPNKQTALQNVDAQVCTRELKLCSKKGRVWLNVVFLQNLLNFRSNKSVCFGINVCFDQVLEYSSFQIHFLKRWSNGLPNQVFQGSSPVNVKQIVLQWRSLIWTLWQLRGTVISGPPSSRTWSTLGGSTSTPQGSRWLPTCLMTLICRWYQQKKLLKAFSGQWLLHSRQWHLVMFSGQGWGKSCFSWIFAPHNGYASLV